MNVQEVLNGLIDDLEHFAPALKDFGDKLLRSSKVKSFLKFRQQESFEIGERPDGSQIGEYAESTKRAKEREGKEYDFVNLYDFGSFYESIVAENSGDGLIITSKDPKTELIEKQYGKIFGLTQEQLKELQDFVKPDFIKFAKNYFNRKR